MSDSGGIIDLEAIWRAYKAAAAAELDRSPTTIASYEKVWADFAELVERPADLPRVLAGAIRYREDLRARRLASNTLHGRISALRAIWQWADQVSLVPENPLRRLRLPRSVSNPRPAIEREAYEDLIRRLPELEPVPQVIIAIAAFAGLRASEIRNLNVEDVDTDGRVIKVRSGKGRKDRTVRMHPELAKVLERCAAVASQGPGAAERLRDLCRRDGLTLHGASLLLGFAHHRLSRIVQGVGVNADTAERLAAWDREWSREDWLTAARPRSHAYLGVERGRPYVASSYSTTGRIARNAVYRAVSRHIDACPHQFRTTWITLLLEHPVPIQVVAEEAGHSALDTTRAYIGRRDARARDRIDAVEFVQRDNVVPLRPDPEVEDLIERMSASLRAPRMVLPPPPEDDDPTPEQLRQWDAEEAAAWDAVLERNPWFPGFLARGVEVGGWFLPATTDATVRLMAGADPLERVDCGPYPATEIIDLEAMGSFCADQGCLRPPLMRTYPAEQAARG